MNRVIARLTAALLLLGPLGCGGPPQIGADKTTFKSVDALYTAVGLRDLKLVEECGQKLKSLRIAGQIPQDAFSSLESIIAEAKTGMWEPAQERLSWFMEGQQISTSRSR